MTQFDAIRSTDWDVLLVMDACRWDVWAHRYGHGERVRSPASCTREWLGAFTDAFDTADMTCVTANPVHWRHYGDAWADRVDVWRHEWRQFNGIPTVSPKDTSDAAQRCLDIDGRLYVHYIQPHGPYPWADPPVPVMRANPEAKVVDVEAEDVPDEIIMHPMDAIESDDGWLTAEHLRDAYQRNLSWVYDALLPFRNLDATVAVTSDHGEFLADGPDGGEYGHPCGTDHHLLRDVPFWVID